MDKEFLKKLVVWTLIVLVLLWGTLIYLYQQGLGPFASPSDRTIFPLVITMWVTTFVTLIIIVPIVIGRFVYVDAHKRGMNRLLWTLVAIFVPYFVGLVVYLVVRSPVQGHCTSCNAVIKQHVLFCPQCGNVAKRQCETCKGALEATDRFCPYCGATIEA